MARATTARESLEPALELQTPSRGDEEASRRPYHRACAVARVPLSPADFTTPSVQGVHASPPRPLLSSPFAVSPVHPQPARHGQPL